MRVYLDNCCFNRPFDEQNNIQIKLETEAKLHIQRLIAGSKLELAWSFILDYENSRNPYKNRKAFVDKWEKLSKLYIEPTDEIILKSESFQKFGIKEKAIVVKKYKEKTVVSKSYNFTSRGKTPITTSKYFKHYVIVRYPISDSKNELLELFNKNNHVLSFLTKESFDAFNEGETIDIIHYNRNNNEHILLAFEVENPPFFNSHYYLFFIIGFIISLLVYRKL